MDFAALKTGVRSHAGIAVDDTTAGELVNDAYKSMVARAHYLQKEVALGDTVALQERYELPEDVVDLKELWVGGDDYLQVSTRELARLKNGKARLPSGWDRAFAATFEDDGSSTFGLFPIPDAGGAALVGLAAVTPPDLTGTQVPLVPVEFHKYIRDGAVADGLQLIDERHDSAAPFEARYEAGVGLLGRRKHSRVGSGPIQARVKGAHW